MLNTCHRWMNPNAASIPQLFTLIVIVINSCTHSSDPHCGINIYVYCKLILHLLLEYHFQLCEVHVQ